LLRAQNPRHRNGLQLRAARAPAKTTFPFDINTARRGVTLDVAHTRFMKHVLIHAGVAQEVGDRFCTMSRNTLS
jgi:hypothetical protein